MAIIRRDVYVSCCECACGALLLLFFSLLHVEYRETDVVVRNAEVCERANSLACGTYTGCVSGFFEERMRVALERVCVCVCAERVWPF